MKPDIALEVFGKPLYLNVDHAALIDSGAMYLFGVYAAMASMEASVKVGQLYLDLDDPEVTGSIVLDKVFGSPAIIEDFHYVFPEECYRVGKDLNQKAKQLWDRAQIPSPIEKL